MSTTDRPGSGTPAEGKGKQHGSPFVDMSRDQWSALAESMPLPLNSAELAKLRGSGDRMDLDEVSRIYMPLSRLLNLYVTGMREVHRATSTFLAERAQPTPYVIGIAGSVAVGKSTTARVLQTLLSRWPRTPSVELVTTDGFLYPNDVLAERGILHRKGFPESYDRRRLLRFIIDVKSGKEQVHAPKYSHVTYDIVPGEEIVVNRPDVLIVEGLNVLQPSSVSRSGRHTLAVSDFFDFSLYVHAPEQYIRNWYIERFLTLRETAFTLPESYFRRYADLSDEEARETATKIWETINKLNLDQNILPTLNRARVVLQKGADHAVTRIKLRKL